MSTVYGLRVLTALAIGIVARADDAPATKPEPTPAAAAQPAPATPSHAADKTDAETASTANPAGIEGIEKTKRAIQAKLDRLKESAEADKAKSTSSENDIKDLSQVYQERLADLDAWKNAVQDRTAAEHEAASPQDKVTELDGKLKHARAQLERAKTSPDSILPELFHTEKRHVTDTTLTEMKDAISIAQEQANDLKAQLDTLAKAQSPEKISATIAGLRAQREKSRAAIASLAARDAELDGIVATSASASARELARERILNLEIETRIETEKPQEVEAKIAIERQKSAHVDLKQKSLLAQCDVAKHVLELMQARYRSLADQQQHELEKAAAKEQDRAKKANDPIEQYRARKAASFLDLQAAILKDEGELTSNPPPTMQEEMDRVEKSKQDFEGLKKLISSGRSNAMVATRLTNSYRRLAAERESIMSRELAQSGLQISRYENALTEVEFDLLSDTREDQVELDGLLARLPKSRHGELLAVAETTERRHRTLLETRQRVLTKLTLRAEETHKQILERIRLLEEQHTYIRTHIFWVRDGTPLSVTMIPHVRDEAWSLGRAVVAILIDIPAKASRVAITTSYVFAMIGVVTFPWGIYRLRKALHGMLGTPRRDVAATAG